MPQQKVGRYLIKSELGRGGMATVYHAYDPRFGRDVAVKVLPREFLHDPTFRARFEREAKTIAALEHAAIVPVYDFGEEDGQPYLVMRFMPDGSLEERLTTNPQSVAEAVTILGRIASALDHAHSQGVVHRDLKPGNILFDQYDEAFLSDFGIAKLTGSSVDFTGDATIGTPAYMSPEQARGDATIDGRSDIYALGAILFEMLTGKRPYQSDTPMGLALKHITEPVPHILEARPDLPADCEFIIARAMAKDREARFATASEMVETLTAVAQGETIPVADAHPETAATFTTPESQPEQPLLETEAPPLIAELGEVPPTSRVGFLPGWVWAAGAVALVLLVGGIVVLSGIGGKAPRPTPTPSVIQPLFTATATPTDTPTPTLSATPTYTPTPTLTSTPTGTPTDTPTWTVTSSQTSIPEAACIYDVELIEVRDPFNYWYTNSHPTFDLVLHNNGTCPWPDDTALVLVSENILDWQESWSIGAVDLGERKEIEIKLTAPGTPQTLLVAWQLQVLEEQLVGPEITRTLRIELYPTATPPLSPLQMPQSSP